MSNELANNDGKGLVELIHNTGDLVIPKPFERDIFLFSTHVAGTTHVENIKEVAETLTKDTKLSFFREPKNAYDDNAIVIKTSEGQKVGYVPKKDNPVFSRLMDAGKLLFGKITSLEKKGSWVEIKIDIILHE